MKLRNAINADIYLSIIYFIIEQLALFYMLNTVISSLHHTRVASDYFASMAIFMVVANIFIMGGDSVLLKTLPLLKKHFKNTLGSNLVYILSFFLRIYIIILIVSTSISYSYFLLHRHNLYLFAEDYDSTVIFLFIVFFIIVTNYGAALLRAYQKIRIMYYISIGSLLFQALLFYSSHYYLLHLASTHSQNLLYNYIFDYFCGYLLSTILFIIFCYFKIVKRIQNTIQDKTIIYQDWQQELKFYMLLSIQTNWIFFITIVVRIFSSHPYSVATFSYIFGIIGFIYVIKKIFKQVSANYIATYIANMHFKKLKKFCIKMIIISIILVTLVILTLLMFSHVYLKHLSITQFYFLLLPIMFSESFMVILDPILNNFLLFYTKHSLYRISSFRLILFIMLIITSIIMTYFYGLSGAIYVFFSFSLLLTIIQSIIFIHYWKEFKHSCLVFNKIHDHTDINLKYS